MLPNPDFSNTGNRGISREEALKFFKKCFDPEFSTNAQTVRENQNVEQLAFLSCFDRLTDYDKGKLYKFGGRLKIAESKLYEDYGGPPKDFSTLIRNVLLVKLGLSLSLHTRQVISSNFKYIYILVYADEDTLENEAEATEFNLQLEVGVTDLSSLEPCDRSYRPLRLLQSDAEIKQKLKELTESYSEIMECFKVNESEGSEYPANGVTLED